MRSLISVVWELGARIFTTFMLFGVFESVSQKNKIQNTNKIFGVYKITFISFKVSEILGTVTPLSVWSFLTSETLKEVMIVRFILGTLFVIFFYPFIVAFGPIGEQILG